MKPSAMQTTAKNLRTFGVGGGIIFLAIWALRFFVLHHGNAWLLLAAAAYLLVTGLFWHTALRPVFIGWTWIAHKIGWFNTRLLLGIIFYGVLTPIGFLMRLFGRDLLQEKLDSRKATYWLPVTCEGELTQYEKEF